MWFCAFFFCKPLLEFLIPLVNTTLLPNHGITYAALLGHSQLTLTVRVGQTKHPKNEWNHPCMDISALSDLGLDWQIESQVRPKGIARDREFKPNALWWCDPMTVHKTIYCTYLPSWLLLIESNPRESVPYSSCLPPTPLRALFERGGL